MEAAPLPLPTPQARSRPRPPPVRSISISSRTLAITVPRASGASLLRGTGSSRRTPRTTTVNAVVGGGADLAPVEITWQIVVGALAGITPFMVAGIEFSKRIIAQRKCEVCGGSGLVLKDEKYYARCPGCGGFLPWQSWKRFFTG